MQKVTLTQAIHDLKVSFRKRFGPEVPLTTELEQAINLAAKEVKKGFTAEWYEDNGVKIKLTKVRRWRAMPQSIPPGGGAPNQTGRNRK